MLNRSSQEQRVSVMDAIHEVKLYNANSTLKEEVAEDKV
jgi:hypothetical protein